MPFEDEPATPVTPAPECPPTSQGIPEPVAAVPEPLPVAEAQQTPPRPVGSGPTSEAERIEDLTRIAEAHSLRLETLHANQITESAHVERVSGCNPSVPNTDCQPRSESFSQGSDPLELDETEIRRRQQVSDSLTAELIHGAEIDWENDVCGWLSNCPGEDRHTTSGGHRDCRINIDGVPTVFCFHENCRKAVGDFNRELRKRIFDVPNGERAPSKVQAAGGKEVKWPNIIDIIRRRTAATLPVIIQHNAWPREAMLQDSPVPLADMAPEQQWKEVVSLLPDSDELIWIGQKMESGREEHADKFRRRRDWLAQDGEAPANFILPAMLRPGSISRTKADITRKTVCVVESDDLNHDEIGAVFKWLTTALGWKLHAVVDTAGKSLHGWYQPSDLPPKELEALITGLKCDASVLRETQPVRLPGAMRDGRLQKLVYLRRNQP